MSVAPEEPGAVQVPWHLTLEALPLGPVPDPDGVHWESIRLHRVHASGLPYECGVPHSYDKGQEGLTLAAPAPEPAPGKVKLLPHLRLGLSYETALKFLML